MENVRCTYMWDGGLCKWHKAEAPAATGNRREGPPGRGHGSNAEAVWAEFPSQALPQGWWAGLLCTGGRWSSKGKSVKSN